MGLDAADKGIVVGKGIGCLRRTPARGGVAVILSAKRRWMMGKAPRRRGTAEEVEIQAIACP